MSWPSEGYPLRYSIGDMRGILAQDMVDLAGSINEGQGWITVDAVGDGIADDAPSLANAITTAIALGVKTVLVPKMLFMKSSINSALYPSITSANPVSVWVPNGAGFSYATGLPLAIHGPLLAGSWRVFYGAAFPSFTGGTFPSTASTDDNAILPEWFGAVGDGVTDDYAAILKAISVAGVGELRFAPKVYGVIPPTGVLAWNGGTTYAISALAAFGGNIYMSLQAGNLGNQPDLDVSHTWWIPAPIFLFQAKKFSGQNNFAPVTLGSTIKVLSSPEGVWGSILYVPSSMCQVKDFRLNANGLCQYGFHGWSAHAAIMDNVEARGATSHGFFLDACQVADFTRLSAESNGGDGIVLQDCNASRLHSPRSVLNAGNGISVISRAFSAGVTINTPDIESNGVHGVYCYNINSKTDLFGMWMEEGDGGDGIRLEGCKHVSVYGGRWTGIGGGANRAVRIMSSPTTTSSGIGLIGLRIQQSTGNVNYNAIEVDAGQTSIDVFDVKLLAQSDNAVVTDIPVTGAGAAAARTYHAANVTAAPVFAGVPAALADAATRVDLNSLGTKVNEVRTALVNAGLMTGP